MEYRQLGASELEVSAISMGLWAISGDDTWGPQDEAAALEAIDTAIEVGINYFDTAEVYGDGHSERLLGTALAGHDRADVIVSSKVARKNLAPADLYRACEASLERLGTDYIDVYHIHWPNHDVPLAKTIDAMRSLRDDGLIRHIAVSNFGPRDLTDLLTLERPVTNQLPYSLLWRAIEYEIADRCIDHGVGITAYSPLAQGLLVPLWDTPDDVPDGRARTRLFSSDRPMASHGEAGVEDLLFATIKRFTAICEEYAINPIHAALAWTLSRPGVDHVLVGGRSPEEIRESAAAVDCTLPADVTDRLTAATANLMSELGPNPDLWHADSRYR